MALPVLVPEMVGVSPVGGGGAAPRSGGGNVGVAVGGSMAAMSEEDYLRLVLPCTLNPKP